MRIDDLKKYDPDMQAQEFEAIPDGVYTFQVVSIKEKPLDMAGNESETFVLEIMKGELAGAKAFLSVFTKNEKTKWKVANSRNMLAGLKECSGNNAANYSHELIGSIVDAEIKQSTGKDGRVFCNVVKFFPTSKIKNEEITEDEDLPF